MNDNNTPTAPTENIPVEPAPTKSKPPVTAIVIGLLLVVAGVSATGYYLVLGRTSQYSPEPVSSNAPTASSAQEYLLQSNQSSRGVSVGYIKMQKPTSKGNLFVGHAYAESTDYHTGVFYITLDSRIHLLDTVTKVTTAVTTNGSSAPVFSSISQSLAFKKECTVYAKKLGEDTETVIKEGVRYTTPTDTASICYAPSAWSPDGKRLAIIGTSLADAKLGLVTLSKLYVYSIESKVLEAYDPPASFNTVYGGIRWLGNDSIAVNSAEFGEFAKVLKQKPYKVRLSDKTYTELGDNFNYDFSTAQVVGNEVYARTTNGTGEGPVALVSGPIDGGDLNKVAGSDDAGTFLVQTNSDATQATNIYMLNGSAGSENSFNLIKLPAAGGTATTLFSPKGYSAYMLGWGQDFDQIIYMAVPSGKSEIRQYTVSTQADIALVSDLPLIQ